MLIDIEHKDGVSFVNINMISEISPIRTRSTELRGSLYNIPISSNHYSLFVNDNTREGSMYTIMGSDSDRLKLAERIKKEYILLNSSHGQNMISVFKNRITNSD